MLHCNFDCPADLLLKFESFDRNIHKFSPDVERTEIFLEGDVEFFLVKINIYLSNSSSRLRVTRFDQKENKELNLEDWFFIHNLSKIHKYLDNCKTNPLDEVLELQRLDLGSSKSLEELKNQVVLTYVECSSVSEGLTTN